MARAQGARAQMGLAFETVYGTPPAAGSYWRIPFASTTLGSDQPLLANELLGYGRDPLAPVRDAVTTDGNVVVPMDLRFLGIWLKALFDEPTTTGTGPYLHEFHSGGWTLPSMSIEVGNPEVPSFRLYQGCVANSISWTMQRTGLVTATVELVAQQENPDTVTAAGGLADMVLTRFGSFQGCIHRDGVEIGNVVSGSVTYSNNLDRIETICNDGNIDGADPSIAALTGEITVRFANTDLLDQATAGDPCELDFHYHVGADTPFHLIAHAVYLPKPRLSLEGPGGVQVTFAWQAALDPVTGRMCTVTLANDVTDYANPV